MKNRKAWWLAAVLAVVLLGGAAGLGISFVVPLPQREWGFGEARILVEGWTAPRGRHFLTFARGYKFGVVAIRRPGPTRWPPGFDPAQHRAVKFR